MAAAKMTKNQMRRAKKKEQRKAHVDGEVSSSLLFLLVDAFLLTAIAKRFQGT
jgi:hypothetical protein